MNYNYNDPYNVNANVPQSGYYNPYNSYDAQNRQSIQNTIPASYMNNPVNYDPGSAYNNTLNNSYYNMDAPVDPNKYYNPYVNQAPNQYNYNMGTTPQAQSPNNYSGNYNANVPNYNVDPVQQQQGMNVNQYSNQVGRPQMPGMEWWNPYSQNLPNTPNLDQRKTNESGYSNDPNQIQGIGSNYTGDTQGQQNVLNAMQQHALRGYNPGTENELNKLAQQVMKDPGMGYDPQGYKQAQLEAYDVDRAKGLEALQEQLGGVSNTGMALQDMKDLVSQGLLDRKLLETEIDQRNADRLREDLFNAIQAGQIAGQEGRAGFMAPVEAYAQTTQAGEGLQNRLQQTAENSINRGLSWAQSTQNIESTEALTRLQHNLGIDNISAQSDVEIVMKNIDAQIQDAYQKNDIYGAMQLEQLRGEYNTLQTVIDGQVNVEKAMIASNDTRYIQDRVDQMTILGFQREDAQLEIDRQLDVWNTEYNGELTRNLENANLEMEYERLGVDISQFASKQEWDTWATQAGLNQDKINMLWEADQNAKDRAFNMIAMDANNQLMKEVESGKITADMYNLIATDIWNMDQNALEQYGLMMGYDRDMILAGVEARENALFRVHEKQMETIRQDFEEKGYVWGAIEAQIIAGNMDAEQAAEFVKSEAERLGVDIPAITPEQKAEKETQIGNQNAANIINNIDSWNNLIDSQKGYEDSTYQALVNSSEILDLSNKDDIKIRGKNRAEYEDIENILRDENPNNLIKYNDTLYEVKKTGQTKDATTYEFIDIITGEKKIAEVIKSGDGYAHTGLVNSIVLKG